MIDHLMAARIEETRAEYPARNAEPLFSPSPPSAGPTVTFRRRRVVEIDGKDGRHETAGTDEATRLAVKTSKVYRTGSTIAAAPASPLAAPCAEVLHPDQGPAKTARRRKPASQRAPRLISHTIFERPPSHVEDVSSLGRGAELLDFSLPNGDGADYRSVCRALERVREELKLARRASRFNFGE